MSQAKAKPACMRISQRSVLAINGPNVQVMALVLDGTLLVDAVPEAQVTIDGLSVNNEGWRWMGLKPNKPMTENMAIRWILGAVASALPAATPEMAVRQAHSGHDCASVALCLWDMSYFCGPQPGLRAACMPRHVLRIQRTNFDLDCCVPCRGFKVCRHESMHLNFQQPGHFSVPEASTAPEQEQPPVKEMEHAAVR